MKRREARERIAVALTDYAMSRLRQRSRLFEGLAGTSPTPTPRSVARVARLTTKLIGGGQAHAERATADVAAVLADRGVPPDAARAQAVSLVQLVQTLAVEFPDEDDLRRAAGMLAAHAVGSETEHPKRLRAALDAWQALEAARSATLPAGAELERLMAEGPLALERHRARRRHELGVDDLQAAVTRTWVRCLRA